MSTGTRIPKDRFRDRHQFTDRLSRHDIVLAVIPVAFLLGLVAAGLADVPLRLAMGAAGAVGALALIDGLFLNPPRRPGVGPR